MTLPCWTCRNCTWAALTTVHYMFNTHHGVVLLPHTSPDHPPDPRSCFLISYLVYLALVQSLHATRPPAFDLWCCFSGGLIFPVNLLIKYLPCSASVVCICAQNTISKRIRISLKVTSSWSVSFDGSQSWTGTQLIAFPYSDRNPPFSLLKGKTHQPWHKTVLLKSLYSSHFQVYISM